MRATLLGLTLLAAACGHAARPATTAPGPESRTTVKVINQNFLDMDAFVVSSGQRIPLGTVGGSSTRVLTLPAALVSTSPQVHFVFRPVGGGGAERSETITVSPGDQVELTIPPQ
jgi:hypothetical protein